jgi:hypothetical protein
MPFEGRKLCPKIDLTTFAIRKHPKTQRDTRDKKASVHIKSVQILKVKISEITKHKVTGLHQYSVITFGRVIRHCAFAERKLHELFCRQFKRGMDFQGGVGTLGACTGQDIDKCLIQSDLRRIGSEYPIDAWNFHGVNAGGIDGLTKSKLDQILEHHLRLRFGHLVMNGLCRDRLAGLSAYFSRNAFKTHRVSLPKGKGSNEVNGSDLFNSLKSAAGLGYQTDDLRGKKSSGSMVAALRACSWPPRQALLGNVIRHHHLEANLPKSLGKILFLYEKALNPVLVAVLSVLILSTPWAPWLRA